MRWSLATALALVAAVVVAAGESGDPRAGTSAATTEVVVTLAAPSLADARPGGRTGGGSARLELHSNASRQYLRRLARAQSTVARRIEKQVPGAAVHWRYRIVLDALAVVVPAHHVAALRRVQGVRDVYPSARFGSLASGTNAVAVLAPRGREQKRRLAATVAETGAAIGAPALWGPDMATAGQGIKIGIIDDGVDQTHPFFSPAGFEMPAGFPKGNTAYTSAKVIVARAFPPPSTSYRNADLPFDPKLSSHGTHVAGIAAGDAGAQTAADGSGDTLAGIAPRAYIGNYKALTVPTPAFGLDGNSPEIVRAIEAAVADGMDVVNLSLGEPEIEPTRDIVVRALDGAARAGVVVAVAAGNEYGELGAGSIDSPGSTPRAITAAADQVTTGRRVDRLATFSSAGPTGMGLLLKPDVTAPGVDVLSSVPRSEGSWMALSGTSMATPHVAGAAALLQQRHPQWSPEQIKSALVLTGVPVLGPSGGQVAPTRQGGGGIALQAADQPLLFASPSSISFGFLHRGGRVERSIELADAGGGAGEWKASLTLVQAGAGVHLSLAPALSVPARLSLRARASASAPEGDTSGFVVLAREGVKRRIPFWLRVTAPKLGLDRWSPLRRAGTYAGDTRGHGSHVVRYLYPQRFGNEPAAQAGPEQVFRFRLRRPVANFGVVVLATRGGAMVTPRIVRGNDENRLQGLGALPLDINPYRSSFDDELAAAAALRPSPGLYQIVFDSVDASAAGRYRFRFWVDDTSPPQVKLLALKQRQARLAVRDRGSGVDPGSIHAQVDGRSLDVRFDSRTGVATLGLARVAPGRHRLELQAADYQEAKNMENTGPILGNTARFSTTIVLR